jgi:hypothetical protein
MKPSRVAGMVTRADVERLSGPNNPASAGEAEIEHLDPAVGVGLDIRRLQVAVHDPAFVRRFDGIRDQPGDLQGVRIGKGPATRRSASVGPSTSSSTSARPWAVSSSP